MRTHSESVDGIIREIIIADIGKDVNWPPVLTVFKPIFALTLLGLYREKPILYFQVFLTILGTEFVESFGYLSDLSYVPDTCQIEAFGKIK